MTDDIPTELRKLAKQLREDRPRYPTQSLDAALLEDAAAEIERLSRLVDQFQRT